MPRLRGWHFLVVGAAAAAVLAGVRVWQARGVDGAAHLARHLEDVGRVVVVGGDDLLRLGADGTTLVAASEVPGLDALLDGTDEAALARALADGGIAGIVADGRGAPTEPRTMRERLAAYAPFDHLQAVYLAPSAALYVPRSGLVLSEPHPFALAYVARAILGGARPPRVQSFPEPLRRIRNVEVMVMIEEGDRPRLWRSARGSSIARALVTASIVARQRWTEREPAMGGPLDDQLASLGVAVYLLDEDGSLGSRSPAFVERVFTPEHGVAFDHLGTWRYLLPDATRERGEGSAMRAYAALFSDSDMPEDSASREDVRLYRLLARLLARSPAAGASAAAGGSGTGAAPAELAARGSAVAVPAAGARSGAR
jgi:hypothetical protein